MAKKIQCLQRYYKKGKKGVSSTLSARKLSLSLSYIKNVLDISLSDTRGFLSLLFSSFLACVAGAWK